MSLFDSRCSQSPFTTVDQYIRIFILFLLCVLLTPNQSAAQSPSKLKKEGDSHFRAGEYRQALNYYIRYNQYKQGVRSVMKRLAICQFENNQVENALENINTLLDQESQFFDPELYYFRGACLQHMLEFEDAIIAYKKYLAKVRNKDKKKLAIDKIKNCASGLNVRHQPALGVLENAGPVVNSIEDDIAPLFSKNYSGRIYFASNFDRNEANPLNAKGSQDIYFSELESSQWSAPAIFPSRFTTAFDEIPLDFFNKGEVMYFQRGRIGERAILIDTFSQDTFESSRFAPFTQSSMPIFPELGDQNVHNYDDSLVLFSSQRPGGFGGYDIYFILRTTDGWSAPENMGPQINSIGDDVDPFLSNNGATIYFSSNRTASIGGFDIFRTRFNPVTTDWGEIENMGIPINSGGNDRGVQVSQLGNSLVFSSDRKTGYGGYDLYFLYAKQLLGDMNIVRGSVTPGFLIKTKEIQAATDRTKGQDTFEVVTMDAIEVDTIKRTQGTILAEATTPVEIIPDIEIEPIVAPEIIVDESRYPKKNVPVASVYYGKNDLILNPQAIIELDKVAQVLRNHPSLTVQLISHSSGFDGAAYFDIYFSAKRAEQVMDYLSDKGVNKSSISILSVGNDFPYAEQTLNDQLAEYSTKLNRRIDLRISGGTNYNLSFTYSDAGIDAQFITDKQTDLIGLLEGVSFKVQIRETAQIYKNDVLENNPSPTIEKIGRKNAFLYTVGWSQEYLPIKVLALRLRTKGYKNAEVIAYYQGNRLDELGARTLFTEFPELKKYLIDLRPK